MTIRPFPFGFFYSADADMTQAGGELNWESVSLPDAGQLWVSNDQPVSSHTGAQYKSVWIGYAAWLDDETPSDLNPAAFTVETLQKGGWSAFHESMDLIVGRFVAFVWSATEFRVYHDSTAIRPVYFNAKDGLIASHGPLLRELRQISGALPQPLRKLGQHKLWEETEDPDVSALPPNFYLDARTGRINRFYPHSPIAFNDSSEETRLSRASEIAKRSVQFWESLPLNLYCAFTGGLDTRLNASAVLASKVESQYVTYGAHGEIQDTDSDTEKSYKLDFQISSTIAESLGLSQILLSAQDSSSYRLSDEERQVLESNTFRTHALRFQGQYENVMGREPSLCLVGTAFGGMRDHFISGRLPLSPFEEFKGALRVIAGFSRGSRDLELSDELAAELWERYEIQSAVDNNYPIANLLCIELRAARFQNEAINGQATAFLPINPLAIREFFEISQGYTFKQRKNSDFLYAFIENEYPALSNFPVNEEPKHIPVDDVSSDIKVRKTTSPAVDSLVEDAPQNRNDRICLDSDFLHKGAAKWFEKSFPFETGSVNISIRNRFYLGKASTNLELFVSVNQQIIDHTPIGLQRSPLHFHIEGLKEADIVRAGIRSIRDNGPAWESRTIVDLLEWEEVVESSSATLSVSSTAHLRTL